MGRAEGGERGLSGGGWGCEKGYGASNKLKLISAARSSEIGSSIGASLVS